MLRYIIVSALWKFKIWKYVFTFLFKIVLCFNHLSLPNSLLYSYYTSYIVIQVILFLKADELPHNTEMNSHLFNVEICWPIPFFNAADSQGLSLSVRRRDTQTVNESSPPSNENTHITDTDTQNHSSMSVLGELPVSQMFSPYLPLNVWQKAQKYFNPQINYCYTSMTTFVN